jgi:hypothetical protein
VSRLNVASLDAAVFTHEGANAWPHARAEQRLRRSVLSCLLWEREFYEDGQSIAERITEAAEDVRVEVLASLAIEARTAFKLRHVPLLLLTVLARRARGTQLVSQTMAQVIQRADELTEFLALYAKANGVAPNALKPKLSGQVKKGLAAAFTRFDEYQLAKYDRAGAVRLRDVLFLSHAKPADDTQAALWKRLIASELATPDTWEVALSGGADKKETFERLIREGRLGYLALLRNLRNMAEADCDRDVVRGAILARKGADRVLPFRFVAAAKAAPTFEPELDAAMLAALAQAPKLAGRTVVIVDVSGSMRGQLSARSDMTRMTAACALAAIMREVCERVSIYATAGNDRSRIHATAEVPARRGLALVDAIPAMKCELGGGGIFLRQAMDFVSKRERGDVARTVVITDEQDCGIAAGDSPANAKTLGRHNYVLNVASYRNGIGYGKWTHIDGFSEQVVRFIIESEKAQRRNQRGV